MAYTIEDELQAQAKLAQIYQTLDRRGRLRLADRLGYRRGSEANRLRQVRRIISSKVEPGKYVGLNSYFYDYVATSDAPEPLVVRSNPWKGVIPPITIKGKVQILSRVMYVSEVNGTYLPFAANRNSTRGTDGENIRALMEDYNDQIKNMLGEYQRNENGETVTIEAIALTDKGAREVVKAYRNAGKNVKDPVVNVEEVIKMRADGKSYYGISLVSTKAKYAKTGKRLDSRPTATYDRRIPRQRRDDIIRYANRAYGQYSRPGGKLA
mgnify:FL=1